MVINNCLTSQNTVYHWHLGGNTLVSPFTTHWFIGTKLAKVNIFLVHTLEVLVFKMYYPQSYPKYTFSMIVGLFCTDLISFASTIFNVGLSGHCRRNVVATINNVFFLFSQFRVVLGLWNLAWLLLKQAQLCNKLRLRRHLLHKHWAWPRRLAPARAFGLARLFSHHLVVSK